MQRRRRGFAPRGRLPADAPIPDLRRRWGRRGQRAGPVAHTPEEFLRIHSLVPRARACDRALLRLYGAGL
jgi:hypothetical protein